MKIIEGLAGSNSSAGAGGPFVGPSGVAAINNLAEQTISAGKANATAQVQSASVVSGQNFTDTTAMDCTNKTNTDNINATNKEDTAALVAEGTALGNFIGNLTAGATGLLPRIAFGMAALLMVGVGFWYAGKGVGATK